MKNISDHDDLIPILKSRQNILVTGPGGSGKTYLTSRYAETTPFSVLTATTGVAALNLGGETIHRFLGIGTESRPEAAGKILNKWERIKTSRTSWDLEKWRLIKNLQTLIIDEASMLRRDSLELIDVVLSYVKDNPLPFGGIQLILVGDFYQLPPVVTSSDLILFKDLKEPYCFQSLIWQQAGIQSYNLTTNFRQGEGEFLDALNNIRIGNVTKEIDDLFASRVGVKLNIPMEPVKLFSHKATVNKENQECLKKLPGEKYVSEAEYEGREYDVNILKRECPAESSLYFCKGAQIIMLVNDKHQRFVNGTMAIIRSINPLTAQLSNGLTINLDLHIWERNVPIIDAKTGNIISKKVASVKQYPFMLAWSSTIHRCQGLTLDYVDVDLSKTFSPGQCYTALSRVKTLDGLTLRGWDKSAVKVDERVKEFYK